MKTFNFHLKKMLKISLLFSFHSIASTENSFKINAIYTEEAAKELIKPRLTDLKHAVANKDIELLSSLVFYPLTITSKATTSENISKNIFKINNKEELTKNFHLIITPINQQFIECLNTENITYNSSRGFVAAFGSFYFDDIIENGERRFAITSISSDPYPIQLWMEKNNCFTSNNSD